MSIGVQLRKAASAFGDKPALRHGGKEQTYSSLNARANAFANALGELGLRKGDRVAIVQYNTPNLIETLYGCFKGGFAAVPLNARLRPHEVSSILRQSGTSAVVLDAEFEEGLQTELRRSGPKEALLICLASASSGALEYERIVAHASTKEPESAPGPEDVAWLFYTSGTTGRPKGAMLTHRNLMAMTMNFLADVYGATETDVALHAAPLTHGSGLYLLPLVARGATNVILNSKTFDTHLLVKEAQQNKVTVLPFLTPTMIKMVLSTTDVTAADLPCLRCIVYGGSPMYAEDIRASIARFGPILAQIYGQGEAPMTISHMRMDEQSVDASGPSGLRLMSAGKAGTDVEVMIFDDNDRCLPPGEMGEIVVRGDVVMTGYWDDPESTAETLRGGWLHTGDIGYVDEKGFLYIMDRKKDMVISGGSNIYPREVEEVILQHPAVHEVSVIGVPDATWGESVKAIVVLKAGATASESQIVAFCKDRIASYKKPRSVEFVDSLPKSPYGKVLKRELREKYWKGQVRRV